MGGVGAVGVEAARILAEYGAEVIKIEPVTGDVARRWKPARDDIGYYFMYSNADKHALAVNMRDEEGWNSVRDLIASADVIVQNMKPGSLDRLGDAATLLQARPDWLSLSATRSTPL